MIILAKLSANLRGLAVENDLNRGGRRGTQSEAQLAGLHLLFYAFDPENSAEASVIIQFNEIRSLIPPYIFNEFGQLTGHFVHYDQIICESGDGRIRIWLNHDAFNEQDPERLICDYAERDLRGW